MRKSIASIAAGALMTALSLFLLFIAYPQLFALFGLLFITSCIILGLSLMAVLPKVPAKIYGYFRKPEKKEEGQRFCSYCGTVLPEGSTYCPRCGGPQQPLPS